MTTSMITAAANDDAELVGETLDGDRDAFGRIVTRYQSLICSLAYSATGSLGQSEDLAQETFITAWKHLSRLRERDKLRAWLCGIARNRINNFLRREGREPIRDAAPLDEVAENHSPEPLPAEYTIGKEEAEILWRALERIPEIYREPLILFYREHQSVETVAEKLDLNEDNARQRLSRGRKLLQEQVLAFVEGALTRTNPGKTFTLAVLAALPAFSATSKAAVLGAAVAKGGATAKVSGAMGLLGIILSPVLVVFGFYSSYRMSMDEARSDQERGYVKRLFKNSLIITLAISLALALPLFWLCKEQGHAAVFSGLLISQTIVVYLLTVIVLVAVLLPARRKYLARILATEHNGSFPPSAYEFRSRASLFGLPLLHIRIGDRFDVMRGPVKAWIAIGSSHAVGVIFASGGIAVAPISVGGIAIGLLSLGGIALGIFPIGGIALGLWAFGGLALGWQICCGCGVALNAAVGGIIFAHDFAVGAIVHAAQANTEMAKQFIGQARFFRFARTLADYSAWLNLLWVVPLAVQAYVVARARRRREQAD